MTIGVDPFLGSFLILLLILLGIGVIGVIGTGFVYLQQGREAHRIRMREMRAQGDQRVAEAEYLAEQKRQVLEQLTQRQLPPGERDRLEAQLNGNPESDSEVLTGDVIDPLAMKRKRYQ